jgi:hypothetical protein
METTEKYLISSRFTFSMRTNTMSSLDDFPAEILVAIAREIHSSVPSLTLVCRRFYELFNPHLYRFVHWSDDPPNVNEMEFPNWLSEFPQGKRGLGNMPRQDSKIFEIDPFLRTLKSSEHLRSLIFGASLGDSKRYLETVQEIVILLRDSIRFLHLRPSAVISTQALPLGLTSLELSAKVLGLEYPITNWYYWSKEMRSTWKVDRELFYSFFALPNLKSLSIADIRGWDWFEGDKSQFTEKVRTSNVTCIKFPGSAPAGEDLAEILSWPKDIQSYFHEVVPEEDETYSCGKQFVDGFYGPDFVEALHTQQATVQEVFITSAYDRGAQTCFGLMDMSSFPSLRRLGLMMDHLNWPTIQIADEDLPQPLPISTRLPPSLVELQIELSTALQDNQYFWDYFECKDGIVSDACRWYEVGELGEWLCEIARSKKNSYPQLRKVTMWQGDTAPTIPEWFDMTRYRNYHQVEDAFREAGILIEWVFCNTPPMLGA